MTEQQRWLCPLCRCPLRFRDFQPGELIFPCPDCGESIEILTSGKRITGIVAVPQNDAPIGKTPAARFPLGEWSTSVLAGSIASPRAISLFATLFLGVVLLGVFLTNRPLPVPMPIEELPADTLFADDGEPAIEPPAEIEASDTTNVESSADEETVSANDAVESEDATDAVVAPIPEIETETTDVAVAEIPYVSPLDVSTSETPAPPLPNDGEDEEETDAADAVPAIDVSLALQTRIARWEQSRSVPLIEVLDQFEEAVGGKIVIERFDAPDVRQELEHGVTFTHRQKTLAEILGLLLKDAGLGYEVRENTIHIAPVKTE